MRALAGVTFALLLPVAPCAAAEAARHLSFTWSKPAIGSPCELQDPDPNGKRQELRLTGTVERGEFGVACTVQIPRRKFDACAIRMAYVQAQAACASIPDPPGARRPVSISPDPA